MICALLATLSSAMAAAVRSTFAAPSSAAALTQTSAELMGNATSMIHPRRTALPTVSETQQESLP